MLRPRLPRIAVSLRRSLHRLPPLEQFENGIPGLFTKDGFRIAWTEYQGLMLEKLNALTAGIYISVCIFWSGIGTIRVTDFVCGAIEHRIHAAVDIFELPELITTNRLTR